MSTCLNCGIPLDAGIFDVAGNFSIDTPNEEGRGGGSASLLPGETLELARYQLSPERCGVLLYFAQFTDRYVTNPRNVVTPGYQWSIMLNGVPLEPWLAFDQILNPWGLNGFPLDVRMDREATLHFVIRNLNVDQGSRFWLRQVGGRMIGRYWFDEEHAGRRAMHVRQEPWRVRV